MDFPLSRYFYDDTDKNFVVFICVNKIRDVDTYSTQKAKFSVKVKLWTFFFRFPVIFFAKLWRALQKSRRFDCCEGRSPTTSPVRRVWGENVEKPHYTINLCIFNIYSPKWR